MTWSINPAVNAALRRAAIGAAIAAIAIQWTDSRLQSLSITQGGAHPMRYDTYPYFHIMAMGIREGRIGQTDLLAVQRYANLHDTAAVFERSPSEAPRMWVNYYVLDVGYSFVVEAARLMFPALPDNYLRPLALQILVDFALAFFVFVLFSQWNVWVGLLASGVYSCNQVFARLTALVFYYFWDIPVAFVVLGSVVLAALRPRQARAWMTLAGLTLGFGVWLRASWWPLSAFLLAVILSSRALRRVMVVPIVAFSLVAVPQIVRASIARKQLAFTTRATWHVALVGLGYYPNSYGFTISDENIFKLTEQKYGVKYRSDDYERHDQAARIEFMTILRNDPQFVARSMLGRLTESLAGTAQTIVPSFASVSNVVYRMLCVAGCIAMMARGGERRLLAMMAAGVYLLYVVLTAAFFFVGLAYSGVSEVMLFLLFVGGVESTLPLVERVFDTEREWLWSHG
jgi:hypothetical protein